MNLKVTISKVVRLDSFFLTVIALKATTIVNHCTQYLMMRTISPDLETAVTTISSLNETQISYHLPFMIGGRERTTLFLS